VEAVLAILGKDLRLRMRDRSVLLFALIAPLGLMLVLSSVFPDEASLRIRAVVVDEDGGVIGEAFRTELVARLLDEEVISDGRILTREDAFAAVRDGSASVAWIVPAGTSDAVAAGGEVGVEVVGNPDRTLAVSVARSVAAGFSGEVARVTAAVTTVTVATGVAPDVALVAAVREAAASTPRPAVVTQRTVASLRLPQRDQLTAGMAVFFLLFTVQLGVLGLLEERQQGTLPRLRAAPIPIGTVLAGKALGALLLGLASMTVLALAARLLLGASWGPPIGTAIAVLAVTITGAAIMAAVGTFAHSAEQASNLQSIVAVGLGLLGGVFVPARGAAAETLALLSPHHWFLTGLGAARAEGEWSAVLPSVGAQLAIAAGAIVIAVWRTRQELAR
jgi:ABC-2 type transport system permease protein